MMPSSRISSRVSGEMMNRMTLKKHLRFASLPDLDLTQTPLSGTMEVEPSDPIYLWLHLATSMRVGNSVRRKSAEGFAALAFLGSWGFIITLRTSRNRTTATECGSAFNSCRLVHHQSSMVGT